MRVLALALLAGCSPIALDEGTFPCESDSDCVAPYVCRERSCVRPASDAGADAGDDLPDAGGGDEGTPDGGGDAGGPECEGSAIDRRACPGCGEQARTCSGGRWGDWGPCASTCGVNERCAAGEVCECRDGYVDAGTGCELPEYCRTHPEPCAGHGTCRAADVPGGWECRCDPNAETMLDGRCKCARGYAGNPGEACADVDECATNQHDCGPHSKCTNHLGTFSCACLHPFVGDSTGRNCVSPCGGAPPSASPGACRRWVCDDTQGWTTAPDLVQNGETCDDANACSFADRCNDGVCTGTVYSCEKEGFVTGGACDGLGSCSSGIAPGKCVIDGQYFTHNDPSPTSTCRACKATTSQRQWTNTNEGEICDDYDQCTTASTCASGVCSGPTNVTCDDANPCTDDACEPSRGCVYAKDPTNTCDDGDGIACTVGRCEDGGCTSAVAQDTCLIDGACWPVDARPSGPDADCLICDPFRSSTGWSPSNEGQICDSNTCQSGAHCASGRCEGGTAVSLTCMHLGAECGIHVTACGGWLNCGSCLPSMICTPQGRCAAPGWAQVAVGQRSTCALRNDGELLCWGDNAAGLLGRGGAVSVGPEAPAPVQDTRRWRSVSLNGYAGAACAVALDDTLWCWGTGSGPLGIGTSGEGSTAPVQVGSEAQWSSVTVGSQRVFACARRKDGTVWCWGAPGPWLGRGTATSTGTPARVQSGETFAEVRAGSSHVLARRQTGELFVWGSVGNAILGCENASCESPRTETATPVRFDARTDWRHAFAGNGASHAVRHDGTLWMWGQYSPSGVFTPTRFGTDADWRETSGFTSSFCGIRVGGTLWCWGANERGQTGVAPSPSSVPPTRLGTSSDWLGVSVSEDEYAHACGVRENGSLWCWGDNRYGQLGASTGIQTSSATPVEVVR